MPANWRVPVKWVTRVGFWTSIFLSLVSMPPVVGFPLALLLAGIEQLLTRAIYVFRAGYIPAMAETAGTLEGLGLEELGLVGFRSADEGGTASPVPQPILALIFQSADQASEFFQVMYRWCNVRANALSQPVIDDLEDSAVSVSLVLEDEGRYRLFIFANWDRAAVRDYRTVVAEQEGDDVDIIYPFVIYYREFTSEHEQPSALPEIRDLLGQGQSFLLAPAERTVDGVKPVPIAAIGKRGLKIKNRRDLNRKEDPVECLFYLMRKAHDES